MVKHLLCVCAILSSLASSQSPSTMALEPNVGQTLAPHELLARAGGANLALSAQELRIARPGETAIIRFAGARTAARLEGTRRLPSVSNYLLGNERSRWRRNVPHYSEARASSVWDGIDLVLHSRSGGLEYDFVVAPGANVEQILLELPIGAAPRVDASGALVHGSITHSMPVAWEERGTEKDPVPARFVQRGDRRFGFAVARKNRAATLVIDPVLVFSTLLGGSGSDTIYDLELDSAGDILVAGYTDSVDFPTANALDPSYGGASDIFVSKLSADGSTLLWSTYLGGSGVENANLKSLALDSNGRIFLSGLSESIDFPTTPGAYQTTYGGNRDATFTILSADGSQILYSTYLGGPNGDGANGVAIYQDHFAYLTGVGRQGFPITPGAPYPNETGYGDVFFSVIAPNGAGSADLAYSTLLGGGLFDSAHAIAVDSNGNAHLIGHTSVGYGYTRFPTTSNAFQAFPSVPRTTGSLPVSYYCMIAPLGNGIADLLYSVVLSKKLGTQVGSHDLAIDAANRAHLAGGTSDSTFPVTATAYQTTFGGHADVFYTIVNPYQAGAASLNYSTFLGGTAQDQAQAIRLVGTRAYLSGSAGYQSSGGKKPPPVVPFPTTPGALQTVSAGTMDVIAVCIDPTLTGSAQLLYSTLYGGTLADWGYGLGVTTAGGFVIGGTTQSTSWPTTAGAFDRSFSGTSDGFVIKIQ